MTHGEIQRGLVAAAFDHGEHVKGLPQVLGGDDLSLDKSIPEVNEPEFTARAVREWLARVGVSTLFIEPGSPWENGDVMSFNGNLKDELIDRVVFDAPLEAKVLIERWRRHYNARRPHSALGYRPPVPGAMWLGTNMRNGPNHGGRPGVVEESRIIVNCAHIENGTSEGNPNKWRQK